MKPNIASIVNTLTPAPQPVQAPPPPPAPAPGGFFEPPKPPKRGGLPLDIVASIQNMYAKEKQAPAPPPGAQRQSLDLQPGWGGQGR